MERTFDEINEIICGLDTAVYQMTKKAVDAFYQYGDRSLLAGASKLSGLSEDEILAWWKS